PRHTARRPHRLHLRRAAVALRVLGGRADGGVAAGAMTAKRELLLRLCAALWGLAIGISLLPLWEQPAPPTQLPGYMKAIGIDAHASFRFALGLMVLPVLVAWITRRAMTVLARDDTRAWARNTFTAATLLSLWYVL